MLSGAEIIRGMDGARVLLDRIDQGDFVVFQRDYPRNFDAYNAIVTRAHKLNKPVLYDIDDLFFNLPAQHPDRISDFFTASLFPVLQAIIEADYVSVSTRPLADYLSRYNNHVFLLPNYLNDQLWPLSPPVRKETKDGKTTIGYMGGHSHRYDFAIISPIIKMLLLRYPDNLSVKFWGMEPPQELMDISGVEWINKENWDYPTFAREFQQFKVDILCAPLISNEFNDSKSPIKYLEYGAVGAAGIYSRVTPYSSVINHGVNGLLASTSDEWIDCFTQLIDSPKLRYQLAKNAHDDICSRWLLSDHVSTWSSAFDEICTNGLIKKKETDWLNVINSINQQVAPFQAKNAQRIYEQQNEINIHENKLGIALEAIENYKAVVNNYEQSINQLKSHISLLTHQLKKDEADLHRIYHSATWKIAGQLNRLQGRMAPAGSQRERVFHKGSSSLKTLYRESNRRLSRKKQESIVENEISVIEQSGFFNRDYYLSQFKSALEPDIDPAEHYYFYGWKEGKDPGPNFSNDYYLKEHIDVQSAEICPLVHYVLFGKKEERKIRNVEDLEKDAALARGSTYHPLVSIIVPNFNHAKFLLQRMESIYRQSYKNIEVILLDDHSRDNSISILKKYAEKYPDITRCEFNEVNSGSPYAQWKKGISLAKGDLIWIAESDDYCDRNFLETLIPYFTDESVLLTYSNTIFVDENGKRHTFAFDNYLSQISQEKWKSSYIETAHNEVNQALGLLNTIPNVSGVLFRRIEGEFPLFRDPDWQKMKVCGDWLFYLNIIRGGRLAFCRKTTNYYRIHKAGISKKLQTRDIYYREHEKIGTAIASLYSVPVKLLRRFQTRLLNFYLTNNETGNPDQFAGWFDIEKVIKCMKIRKPNVLIATYGFAFGGGEIFPLWLANALKDKNVGVTVFNGDYEPRQIGVRKMLYPNIAVINNDKAIKLTSVFNDYGIEIIHTHHASMEYLFANAKLKGQNDVKHVATMHGMYEMMDHFSTDSRMMQISVDHWVYTTDKNLVPFKKNHLYREEKFTRIDNGIRMPGFHALDLSSLGINRNSFVTSLASRALPEKGWRESIQAVGKARQVTNRDIHLLLIGEGPVYTELKTVKVPEYVHLLGYKSNLDDYLAASQLGLIPSYFKGESFPLVMMECFMAGIPVVATRIGEIERMVTVDKDRLGGVLLNLRKGRVNPNDLADAIIKLVMDPGYYQDCKDSVRILKKRFNINNAAQQYISVYRQLLTKGS
jgi:glycosyltransferase involved in cell wall biosynthesis